MAASLLLIVRFLTGNSSLTNSNIIYPFILWTFALMQSVLPQQFNSPGPRKNHCAALMKNSTMVIFGGLGMNNYSDFSSLSFQFNFTEKSVLEWQKLPVNNAFLVSEAACVVTPDNKLLVIGGNPLEKATKSDYFLQLYDPLTKNWTAQTIHDGGPNPFPYLRGHVAVNILLPTGKYGIFVFGGSSRLASDSNPTYILTPHTGNNDWTVIQYPRQLSSPPESLLNSGINFLNNKVFIFGGTLSPKGTPSNLIYSFDVRTEQWAQETLSSNFSLMPCSNCTITVASNDEKNALYVISPSSTTSVQMVSISTNVNGISSLKDSFSVNGHLPAGIQSLSGFSAIPFKDSVIFYGGNTVNTTFDTIYQYNISLNTWTIPGDQSQLSKSNNSTSEAGPSKDFSFYKGTNGSSKFPVIFGSIIGIIGLIALISLFIYRHRVQRQEKLEYQGDTGTPKSKRSSTITAEEINLGCDEPNKKTPPLADVLFISKIMRRLSLLNRNSAVAAFESPKSGIFSTEDTH